MDSESENQVQNEKLRLLLKQWKSGAALPPRFEEEVWLRIERAEAQRPVSPVALIWVWITAKLTRPGFAVGYVALFLFLGISAGSLRGRAELKQISALLRQQYFQMLEPFEPQGPR